MWSRANNGQLISKCMESRRTGKYPLKTSSHILFVITGPRVVPTFRTIRKGKIHNVEKVHKRECTQVGTIRTLNVPTQKGIRVVQIASGHTCLTQEVLREKCKIYTLEEEEKVSLSVVLRVLTPCLFANPEVECSKNSKHRPHAQHIVEVCYYIISHL